MIFEPVISVGWAKPDKRPQPLLVLYVGDDWETAAAVVNSCLDNGSIAYGRVFRGQLMGGQLMYAASATQRPGPAFGEVLQPTGSENEARK